MKLSNHINISLMGLIGLVLLVASKFFSWFSDYFSSMVNMAAIL